MARTPKGAAKAKPWARVKAKARILSPDEQWADELCERVVAGTHPKQKAFVLDPARRVVGRAGRGGGKSTAGIARFIRRMARTVRAKCLYIAPTKIEAREILWDKLKEIFERLGIDATFHDASLIVTMTRTGSKLRLVGADDQKAIDKLRGKPYHEVGIDEAGLMRDHLLRALILRVIGPRLGDYGGCIFVISTPGPVLRGFFYDITRPGGDMHRRWEDRKLEEFKGWTGWSSHYWTLYDGAKYVVAIARLLEEALIEKNTNKWTDDNPIWRREYLAEWSADDTNNIYQYRIHAPDGKTLWNRWDPERVGALRLAKLPGDRRDWLYVIGADMGSSDPFSLQVFAASPTDAGRHIYHVYEYERPKLYARLIAQLLLGEKLDRKDLFEKPGGVIGAIGWPAGMVADMTHLGGAVLDELAHVYGVRFDPADQKEKFASIELFNGDLVDGRMHILAGSRLEEQLLGLQWLPDEFGRPREDKAQANHATDAGIYARRKLAVLFAATSTAVSSRPSLQRPPSPIESDEEDDDDQAEDLDPMDALGDSDFDESWGNGGDF